MEPDVVEKSLTKAGLPSYLTRLDLSFDLTAPGIYSKRSASGEVLALDPGCPDPEGCYYTLNGLVERGTGSADLPIQPYLIYDSRLAGTSQHGVLWMGGTYDEETEWVPVIAELVSNGGDGSDHGDTPRTAKVRPNGTRLGGNDQNECRPTDTELNGLVVVTGEAVRPAATDDVYTIERLYRGIDLEVFYYNNPYDGTGNCDRERPLLGAGPYDGRYHRVEGGRLTWSVPASDDGGVWRVVVVTNDNSTTSGQGSWVPTELTHDPVSGYWIGEIGMAGIDRLTYVIQAVDKRGNVSWLDWVTQHLPSSNVEHDLPDTVDVSLGVIFEDGFESGDTFKWSGTTN